MRAKKTFVILANDKNARFLLNQGIGKGLRELKTISAAQLAGLDVAFADGPGRSRAAPGMARHAVDPRSGEEEQERVLFARRVAEMAGKLWQKQAFDRAVISAEPKVLGLLRELLPAAIREKTVVELTKDLLRVPTRDLPGFFEDHILF